MPHILVVEDDPSNQLVMRKALTKIGGYTVTVSEDVEEILTLTRSGAIDLVVMDVSLGNSLYQGRPVDGLGITQLLKAEPATQAVRVLLATAYAMQGDAERLRAACGADGYIAKPFVEPRDLVNKIQTMLAG